MAQPRLADAFSHWSFLFEDWQESTDNFYSLLDEAIQRRNIPSVRVVRVQFPEGGVFSAKRIYLRVMCKRHIFDICAAPYANGFFVSWWLAEAPGCLGILLRIPVLNLLTWTLTRPVTYYKVDTALMFQKSIHSAVMEVIDAVTTTRGVKMLETDERKPIHKQLFG